jgi:hypothetical protein
MLGPSGTLRGVGWYLVIGVSVQELNVKYYTST